MQFDVTHRTCYRHPEGMSIAHHVARVTPRVTGTQQVQRYNLEIDPAPSMVRQREDYFGNRTHYVAVEGVHRELVFTASSRVMVAAPALPVAESTPPWEMVAARYWEQQSGHWSEVEFTLNSPLIQRKSEHADYARAAFPTGRPVLEGVLALVRQIYQDFIFDPTATTVATPLSAVFRSRRGVCQDFAHLLLGCLRGLGLPARYMSGYLETTVPTGMDRLVGADASHAWVSAFIPGHGWVDVDPTNNLLVGDRHITVAWGRDYSDVSPVRGVVVGSGTHTMDVAVDVVRVGPPL
jgi:transglutaminase-like putative cysteine protease